MSSEQTFQFTCPKCAAVLRVPVTATKFKCPYHDDVYHVKVDDDTKVEPKKKPRRKSIKKRHSTNTATRADIAARTHMGNLGVTAETAKMETKKDQHKGIYSEFDKEMLLMDVEDLDCDGIDDSISPCGNEGKSEVICFNCKRRLCEKHSIEIHAHPERIEHVRLARELFDPLHKMFVAIDAVDEEKDGKVSVKTLVTQVPDYVEKESNRVYVLELLKANIDKFGESYVISFAEFIKELARHIQRVNAAGIIRGNNDEDVLNLGTEAAHYQKMGNCGRWIFDLQNGWNAQKRRMERFHIWAPSIKSIQSNFGANISTYFLFLRFLFYLNVVYAIATFFFLFVPVYSYTPWSSLSYKGFLIGHGMEDSFMFYGGYGEFYNNWNMSVSYVMITALCIMYGLLAAVGDIGGQSNMKNQDDRFKWCDAVFCGLDYQLNDGQTVHLGINAMDTQLKSLYAAQKLRKRQVLSKAKEKKKKRHFLGYWFCFCMKKKVMGKLLSFIILMFSCMIVFFLTVSEQELIIHTTNSDLNLLLVPGIVAVLRVVISKLLKVIVKFERYASQNVAWNHYFSRVFLLRIGFIFALVAGAYSGLQAYQSNNPDLIMCFETSLGVVFYRILLCDYIVEIVLSIIFPLMKVHILNRCYYCMCPGKKKTRNVEAIEMDHMRGQPNLNRASTVDVDVSISSSDNNDIIKEEFDIQDNLVDLTYRQMIVWAALPFSPFIIYLSLVCSALLMYVKKMQVFSFIRRPKKPMAVSRQHRYFRIALIVGIILCLVPYTFFLRQKTECGPHSNFELIETPDATYLVDNCVTNFVYSSSSSSSSNITMAECTHLTVADAFVLQLDVLPNWVQIVLGYVTSSVLLWLLIILLFIYTLTLSNKDNDIEKQLEGAEQRLKIESEQRGKLLAAYGIRIGGHESHGRALFNNWIISLNDPRNGYGMLGDIYGPQLRKKVDGDMIKLCKLTNDQLTALLKTCGASGNELAILINTIGVQRHHIVYNTVRRKMTVS